MYIMHLISVIVIAEDVYGHFCAIEPVPNLFEI